MPTYPVATYNSQGQQVYVHPVDPKRHRCRCCCCHCCHIKIACSVLLVLELIMAGMGISNAVGGLTTLRSAASDAINAVELTICILFILTILLAFAGICFINDKLIIPHIAMQVLFVIWRIIQMCLFIAAVATGADDAKWLVDKSKMSDRERFEFEKHSKKIIGGISGGYIILGVIGILLTVWFIMMFMQLRRFLKEERARIKNVRTLKNGQTGNMRF